MGKAKGLKRRPFYTPPPRLARAALSANGISSTSSTSFEVGPDPDPLVDPHRRLIGEVFLLRGQMQDMVAQRDLLVQQEWLDKHVEHWNPEEEYRRHLFLSGGISHQSGGFSQAATPRSVAGIRSSSPGEPTRVRAELAGEHNHTTVQLADELTGAMVELAGELTGVMVELAGRADRRDG
ncbi:hypothetical protein HID58_067003 [Brassica napus]|uniref:Uncharacterized protein n=1 Tax=Brassica napus TaxID=3708 RepID=A0ABQ7ZHH4_BRANA|nr:hypothetical protein HID58_067003 [Brassica napus]